MFQCMPADEGEVENTFLLCGKSFRGVAVDVSTTARMASTPRTVDGAGEFCKFVPDKALTAAESALSSTVKKASDAPSTDASV